MHQDTNSNANTGVVVKDGLMYHPGLRIPMVVSPEGYEQLSYLDDEDKQLGTQVLDELRMSAIEGIEQPVDHMMLQMRNPTSAMHLADPKLMRNYGTWYNEWINLIAGLSNEEILAGTDINGRGRISDLRRYDTIMLITAKVADAYQDEWCLRLMATAPAWTLSKEQFSLLGTPQSAVWNEEQRITLEFTGAVINRAVTDELFARADAFWGRQQLLRYCSYIGHYIMLVMMGDVFVPDAAK